MSLVHGFATLWLHGNLAEEITSPPPAEAAAAAFGAFATTLLTAAGVDPPRADLGPWKMRPPAPGR